MNITWLGQNCLKIEVKSGNEEVTILTDPFDPKETGLKLPRTLVADVVLQTTSKLAYPVETKTGSAPFIVSGPGEYETKGVFVYAIPTASGKPLLWIEAEQMDLVYLGAINTVPSEQELEAIEDLDILFVPVGGGDVLGAKSAAELVRELEPRIVIPTMFKLPGLTSKAEAVEPFVKAVGAQHEQLPKLKISRKDLPVDTLKLVVLEKS